MRVRLCTSFHFDGAARPGAAVVGAAAGEHCPPVTPVAVPPSAASAVTAPRGFILGRAGTAHGGRFLPALGRSPTAPAPFGLGDAHRRFFLSALIGAVGLSLARGLITIRKPQSCGRSTDLPVVQWPFAPLADHPDRRVLFVFSDEVDPTPPALVSLIAAARARQGGPAAILPGAAS